MQQPQASEIIKEYKKYKALDDKARQKEIKENLNILLQKEFYSLDVENQEQVLNCINILLRVFKGA